MQNNIYNVIIIYQRKAAKYVNILYILTTGQLEGL